MTAKDDAKDEKNPAQTAGTIAGRGATLTPPQSKEDASPGAEADRKTAEEGVQLPE